MSALCLALSAMLGACAVNEQPQTADAVKSAVRTSQNNAHTMAFYDGPGYAPAHSDNSNYVIDATLHAGRSTTTDTAIYSLLAFSYYSQGGFRAYNQAADDAGNSFPASMMDHDVKCYSSCARYETTQVRLSREYLESHAQSGISLSITGQLGGIVSFTVPAYYVQGFLSATRATN
jgi:hypothetical protein